jgi:hypothetical protein
MITLTTAGSGTRVRINPAHIHWFAIWPYSTETAVRVQGHEFLVVETPEQIDQLIAIAKGERR